MISFGLCALWLGVVHLVGQTGRHGQSVL